LAAIDGGATAAGTVVWLDAAIEKKASKHNSDVRREKNIARGLREEAHYTVTREAPFSVAGTQAPVADNISLAPRESQLLQFRRDLGARVPNKRMLPSTEPIALRRTWGQREPDDTR